MQQWSAGRCCQDEAEKVELNAVGGRLAGRSPDKVLFRLKAARGAGEHDSKTRELDKYLNTS